MIKEFARRGEQKLKEDYRALCPAFQALSKYHALEKSTICGVTYIPVRCKRKSSFHSLFEEKSPVSKVIGTVSSSKPLQQVPKHVILQNLTLFIRNPEINTLCSVYSLSDEQRKNAFNSFRKYCLESDNLPHDLEILFHDIKRKAAHSDDLFTYFIEHAINLYPHLKCLKELRQISDLRNPASWYPLARSTQRKVIYHAGPTNSGKTYHALQRFFKAESSVYCGPLKMLAHEVFEKSRHEGIDCDLVTGEERQRGREDGEAATRVSCTVEMTTLHTSYDVAVIDEIQMVQDPQRGWAWTRALLGVAAKEVHLCGEPAAVPLIKDILASAGEELEVVQYERLTPLKIESEALKNLASVQPGDCIVCFNKKDIFSVTQELEQLGKDVAVIYGSLPPGTKTEQSRKFNDPKDNCSIMVATDAIGMGLNLNIRRIIFYSIRRIDIDDKGKMSNKVISVSQALQIAGRAGRYGTVYSQGSVTTYKPRDLPVLQSLLSSDPVQATKAGLHPTSEQLEMFSFHLPNSSLQSLLEVFTDVCQMDDSLYFMCNIETFKYLAGLMQEIPISLRARYIFCCAPVNIKIPFIVAMYTKFARQYSNHSIVNVTWIKALLDWPPKVPQTLLDLVALEYIHDVLDLYLWLSYRFSDIFTDTDMVRDMQKQVDKQILSGVEALTRLLKRRSKEPSEEINTSAEITGSLANKMLKDGILTPEVLGQLRREWTEELKAKEEESAHDDKT